MLLKQAHIGFCNRFWPVWVFVTLKFDDQCQFLVRNCCTSILQLQRSGHLYSSQMSVQISLKQCKLRAAAQVRREKILKRRQKILLFKKKSEHRINIWSRNSGVHLRCTAKNWKKMYAPQTKKHCPTLL